MVDKYTLLRLSNADYPEFGRCSSMDEFEMTTAEAIYELVKTLPEEQANMVLVFAQFLHQQDQIQSLATLQPDSEHPPSLTHAEKLALSHAARGRFSYLPNSSDAFAQHKQDDISFGD
ncbi:MAG: hypothetical protein ACFE0I_11900 [Elainellaceae cyanobacterium]